MWDKHGLASKQVTKRFVKIIDQIKPDIIHLHNIHGYYLNIEVLFDYLKNSNIPVVWTIHDCWPMTGHCIHYTAVNCEKWTEQCFDCPRLGSYPQSLFYDGSRRNFNIKKKIFTSLDKMIIVPVSYWLGSVVARSFLNKYPVMPIQNGIDTETFSPREFSHNKEIKKKYHLENKFVILGVATGWSQENGFYDFLELSKHLDNDCKIVLVGLSQKQIKSLPDNMEGIERTDNASELADLYSCADLFINGSFEETFGLVTAEAISCGTPVIVYDSTACPEIVTPKTGYIVPVRNMEAILLSITDCRNLGKAYFSDNCREYALTNFRKQDKYAEYVDIYNKLLKD